MSLWPTVEATVARPPQSYGARLLAALERAKMPKRRLAAEMAARTGQTLDNERRAIYRYLDGETVPEPDRGAVLAVILDEPELALPPAPLDRRRVRLERLEAEVDALTAALETARQVTQDLVTRVEALEAAQADAHTAPTRRRARRTG